MTTLEDMVTPEAWDAIATGYDEFVTPRWALSERALARLDVTSGTRFLDVACGSGALTLPAGRLGADVLGVDFSPAMIARLEARARAEGLTNVEARVMDGHALDLEDDTFDVAGSQFGVMLFPDLPRGLRELVRVTKPGGRVLMVAYGPPPEIEFLGFFLGAAQAVVPGFTGPPMDPPPLPLQVSDPEKLRREMTETGLTDVRVEPDAEILEFESGTHMWNWLVSSNPIAEALVADVTEEQRAEIPLVLDGMLRERSGGSGPAVLTAAVNIAVGTKVQ